MSVDRFDLRCASVAEIAAHLTFWRDDTDNIITMLRGKLPIVGKGRDEYTAKQKKWDEDVREWRATHKDLAELPPELQQHPPCPPGLQLVDTIGLLISDLQVVSKELTRLAGELPRSGHSHEAMLRHSKALWELSRLRETIKATCNNIREDFFGSALWRSDVEDIYHELMTVSEVYWGFTDIAARLDDLHDSAGDRERPTRGRALLAGCADYTAVPLVDIIADLHGWKDDTEGLRAFLQEQRDVLDKPRTDQKDDPSMELPGSRLPQHSEIEGFITFFLRTFARYSAEFSRLMTELSQGVRPCHAEALRQIARGLDSLDNRCCTFRDDCVDRQPWGDLSRSVYSNTRDMIAVYRNLENVAHRLDVLCTTSAKDGANTMGAGVDAETRLFAVWEGRLDGKGEVDLACGGIEGTQTEYKGIYFEDYEVDSTAVQVTPTQKNEFRIGHIYDAVRARMVVFRQHVTNRKEAIASAIVIGENEDHVMGILEATSCGNVSCRVHDYSVRVPTPEDLQRVARVRQTATEEVLQSQERHKAALDALHADVREIKQFTQQVDGKADRLVEKTSQVIRMGFEVAQQNTALTQTLAKGVLQWASKMEPADFQVLAAIMTAGDVAKAARVLGQPDSTIRAIVESWPDRGPAYRLLPDFVRWRKKVGRKGNVPFNDAINYGLTPATDYPQILRDILTDLEGATEGTMPKVFAKLIARLNEECPR